MAQSTAENGWLGTPMELEKLFIQTAVLTLGSGVRESIMDEEITSVKPEPSTTASGRMGNTMESELSHGQMALPTKGLGVIVESTDGAGLWVSTGPFTKETGLMGSTMDRASYKPPRELSTLDSSEVENS